MTDPDGPLDVDWETGARSPVGRRAALAAGGPVVLAAAFAYDYAVLSGGAVVLGYDVARLEWLWLACLWVDLVYLGALAAGDPARTRRLLARLRRRPAVLAAGVVVAGLLVVGTAGPPLLGQPEPRFAYGNQPPLFTSVPRDSVVACHNPVGDRCFGSPKHPLGTDDAGKDVLTMLVLAARTEVVLLTVTTTLVVPLATAAGATGAYLGGWPDRTVRTVAGAAKAVPAVLVFLTWRWLAQSDGSLFALVVAFGLASWGTVTVVVRSRALDVAGRQYVLAAEAAGAGTLVVVRDHLVPNVSRAAVATAVYLLPLFVTVEATLSFLTVGPEGPSVMRLVEDRTSTVLGTPPGVESWGKMIGNNLGTAGTAWWPVVAPVGALLVTILALNLLADGLRDVLDPRGGD